MHPRTRGNAGFKSQTNDDDHVIPTLTSRSNTKARHSQQWQRRFTAAANPQANSRAGRRVRLTLGHDRWWSFALADLSTGGKTQDPEDHCSSNGDFLHNAPYSH
jgi:hypothetical protein